MEIHKIRSKDKPDVSSASKDKMPRQKVISSVCLRKSKDFSDNSVKKLVSFAS